MILIDEILIHEDVMRAPFTCDLEKCKGACCWKGDYGAPLEKGEENEIKDILHLVLEKLPKENQSLIKEKGVDVFYKGMDKNGTPLMPDGACAFLIRDEKSIGKCAFEELYEEGKTSFKKPISCHLYPIRIERNNKTGMDFVNYDRWSICNPACSLGKKLNTPLFEFCSEALERKYSPDLVEQLREVKEAMDSNRDGNLPT